MLPSCTLSRHYQNEAITNVETTLFKLLKFDSQFESGNLLWSRLIGFSNKKGGPIVQEYDLTIQHDLFTAGNVQWFYYRVGNTRKNTIVRFNRKKDFLF